MKSYFAVFSVFAFCCIFEGQFAEYIAGMNAGGLSEALKKQETWG